MSIRGHFDGIDGIKATGWAQDSRHPEKRLMVELREGEEVLARAEATRFRADLKQADIGDGAHGFQIPLPASLYDGQTHTLSIVAEGKSTLDPGNIEFQSGAPRQCQSLDLRGTSIVVSLDAADAGEKPARYQVWEGLRKVLEAVESVDDDGQIVLQLPSDVLDGMPHRFSVLVSEPACRLGEIAVITPSLKHVSDISASEATSTDSGQLSAIAGFRYESLRRGLARAVEHTREEGLSTVLKRLLAAHEQVVRGFSGKPAGYETLTFPVHKQPDVSIVMPVHNKFSVTYNGLASLLLANNDHSFEVILVDDGSTDETLKAAKIFQGVNLVRHDQAQGFLRSCNDGASRAKGRYVLLLNNDVEVSDRWIDELIWPFDNFEDVGLTGSKLLYPDGRLQEAGGIVWGSGAPWNYGRNGNPADPRYSYTRQVDYLSGASIMIPREFWQELGGFDEDFVPAYYEDTDLAFRVRQAGRKSVFAALSQVVHFEGVSSGTDTGSGIKKYQKLNEPKFRSRWAKEYRRNGIEGREPDIAKDRNVYRRVLMLDSQVPAPDKDAGSYAAIQEIRLLQSLGFKVTFAVESLAHEGKNTQALQRMGVECLYGPYYTSLEHVLRQRGGEFDLVYVTRHSVASKIISAVRKFAPQARILFNNADLHFLREMRAAIAADDKIAKKHAEKTRKKELRVMSQVDLVLSYNEVEHAVILSHNMDSTVVAKCPWVVDSSTDVPAFSQRRDIAFLGGYGHPPNVEAVRYFALEVMPLLRRRMPDVRFLIYGSNVPGEIESLADEDVLIKGFVEDVAEVYNSCRVFIACLLSGAGIKGKVIGALASGVPSVLSQIAAEGTGIRDGVEALIARTPEQWVSQIESLYSNEKNWSEMSRAAMRYAETQYSFRAGQQVMKEALKKVGVHAEPDFATLYSASASPR